VSGLAGNYGKREKPFLPISLYYGQRRATTDMVGKPVDHTQCPSGIIGPDGEWIEKCKDSGSDIATIELTL